MSPLQIRLLLHHYLCPESPEDYFPEPITKGIEDLISWQLLQPCKPDSQYPGRKHKCTDKALVYIEALLALPLPERKWVMPEEVESD